VSGSTSTAAGRGRVEAVLFDIDDTLVDFAASAAAGLVQLLGPEASARDGLSEAWHTLTERHYPRFLAGEVPFTEMQIDRMVELLTWAGLPVPDRDGLLALEERRQQEMTRHYRLFDDVHPCLEALGGWRTGVVSNSDGPHQRAKLASVGLTDTFEVVVISGDVGHPKPDARIFREACRRLDLPPAAVVYVGDRLDVDAEGAAAAGLHGVWLDRSGRSTAPSGTGSPDVPTVTVITGLAELPGLLQRL
jgi:putative hydrolase of the HAD superfamily